jgi:biotin carboxyl carrier protein
VKIRLERGERELLAEVTPRGEGFLVTLDQNRRMQIEGSFGEIYRVRIDGRPVEALVRREGPAIVVEWKGRTYAFRTRDERAPRVARRREGADLARGEIHAPMPGLIVELFVEPGEHVEAGQPILVVEAMKMQNALAAPLAGIVTAVPVTAGMAVDTGQLLVAIRPAEGS